MEPVVAMVDLEAALAQAVAPLGPMEAQFPRLVPHRPVVEVQVVQATAQAAMEEVRPAEVPATLLVVREVEADMERMVEVRLLGVEV